MSNAKLVFRSTSEGGPDRKPETTELEFTAGFDGSVGPLTLSLSGPAKGGVGVEWEENFDLTAAEVRALRAFCDVALAFPHDEASDSWPSRNVL